LEFIAFHGITECFANGKKWFGDVTCTKSSGSARTSHYAKFTDAQMMDVRRREQNAAAVVGQYGLMLQLDYSSAEVKSAADPALKNDLKAILAVTKPQVVYMHILADKHETHIGVVLAASLARRELPRNQRPKKVIGCKVWRDLDCLADDKKVLMDLKCYDHLAGGKRCDLATVGRRAANATFGESHATDKPNQVILGMNLKPLVLDETLDIVAFANSFIENFSDDVKTKLSRVLGRI
jgi:hypothetical protein